MNRNSQSNLIDLVGCIHDFVLDDAAATGVIEQIAHNIDSDKAMLVRLAEDRRRDVALAHFGVERELINEVLRDRENPESFLAHNGHWRTGVVASDGDCARSLARRQKSKFYVDILKPNDIEHTLLGVIDTCETHHVMIWFHRSKRQGAFKAADRRFLETLMPHWYRAIRQKLSYDYFHTALSSAGLVLDQSPFGLYILDHDGRLLYATAVGRLQCQEQSGIGVRNDMLVFDNRDVRKAYGQMLMAARQGRGDNDPRMRPIAFEKTDGNGSYQIGLRRLQLPSRRSSLATRNVLALFVYDTGVRQDLSIESLKSLYGLTDAEARVCGLLYQSKNLPETADILGISINTAKTHLNRSFRKVGVQSQAELVRRLNSHLYIS